MAGKSFLVHYVLPTVAIGVGLGYWQIGRDEKVDQVAARDAVEEATTMPPVPTPPPAEPTVALPARTIDLAQVIGRRRADVDKVLGAGKVRPDKGVRYDLDWGEFAVVVFDHGKAVGVVLPTARCTWTDLSRAEQLRVAQWFGLADITATIDGRDVVVRADFLRVGVAAYDAEYIHGLDVMSPTKKPARKRRAVTDPYFQTDEQTAKRLQDEDKAMEQEPAPANPYADVDLE